MVTAKPLLVQRTVVVVERHHDTVHRTQIDSHMTFHRSLLGMRVAVLPRLACLRSLLRARSLRDDYQKYFRLET